MQKTRLKKSLTLIVCMVLIVAMALFTTGCNGSTDNAGTTPETVTQTESTSQAEDETQTAETEADADSEDTSTEETVTSEEAEVTEAANTSGEAKEETSSADSSSEETESNVLGEGATSFTFTVRDSEGNETVYQINTDQKTVGAALLDLGLIAGEESEYGLYVKTVNGLTVDYDTDGKYWAFYVNGEYAASGVDSTDITAGDTYSFVVE